MNINDSGSVKSSPFSDLKNQASSLLQIWKNDLESFHKILVDANINALDGKCLIGIDVPIEGLSLPNIALRRNNPQASDYLYDDDFVLAVCATNEKSVYKLVNISPEINYYKNQNYIIRSNELINNLRGILPSWINHSAFQKMKLVERTTPEPFFAIVNEEVLNLSDISLLTLFPYPYAYKFVVWSNLNPRNKSEILGRILMGNKFVIPGYKPTSAYHYGAMPRELFINTPNGPIDLVKEASSNNNLLVRALFNDKCYGTIKMSDKNSFSVIKNLQVLNYSFDLIT